MAYLMICVYCVYELNAHCIHINRCMSIVYVLAVIVCLSVLPSCVPSAHDVYGQAGCPSERWWPCQMWRPLQGLPALAETHRQHIQKFAFWRRLSHHWQCHARTIFWNPIFQFHFGVSLQLQLFYTEHRLQTTRLFLIYYIIYIHRL